MAYFDLIPNHARENPIVRAVIRECADSSILEQPDFLYVMRNAIDVLCDLTTDAGMDPIKLQGDILAEVATYA